MSNLITLDSVSHQLGNKLLFDQLKLNINSNQRIGIIGPNGSGKSTLLKIIAGEIAADEGRVIQSNDCRLAYLPQIADFPETGQILSIATSELLSNFSETEASVQASKYLTQVGFENLEQDIAELSGGWQKRLSIAIALAKEANLLLLDEPTNHLDLDGLLWLEDFLKKSKFAWLTISHDRYFLERTAQEVLEVAPYYEQGVFQASGNYTKFTEQRRKFFKQQEEAIASLKNKHRTEKEWMSKNPQGRRTKANYRIKAFHELSAELKNRYALVPKKQAKIGFSESSQQSKILLELINVSFAYEKQKILDKFSIKIKNNARIGILGKNGQGKSTLLKILAGQLKPDAGKVKSVPNLKIVYFDQLRKQIDPNKTLGYILADGSDQVIYQDKAIHIVSWGLRFGFEREELDKEVKELSGGEQARLLLSILVKQEADLLVLDEPGNDLDISMLETLEEAIDSFTGAVLLVSHDRFLISRVCRDFWGYSVNQKNDLQLINFASYEQWQNQLNSKQQHVPNNNSETNTAVASKNTYQERKELAKVERQIQKAEEELTKLQEKAAQEEIFANPEKSIEIAKEIKESNLKIEELYERWEELELIITEN